MSCEHTTSDEMLPIFSHVTDCDIVGSKNAYLLFQPRGERGQVQHTRFMGSLQQN